MEYAYLFISALLMEFIDSFLGMMYGTVLSPLLIIMDYNAKDVVPSILISQAIGGFIASYRHHRFKNADFNSGTTDRRIAVTVIWWGVFASLIGVFISISISPKVLNTYIGLLVTVIGVLILCGRSLILTDGKVYLLGFVSAFNKALSGGGFGPLVAGGQLIFRDRSEKGAIGSTDFAEAPICLFSFLLWVFFKGLPPAALYLPLCAGSAIGGFFGPRCLSKIKSPEKLKKILGTLVLLEGVWLLYKVWIK
ncbi:MAG: sulfite exporter TauE/SafE family protein [Deltaproteobacteria bacterium]